MRLERSPFRHIPSPGNYVAVALDEFTRQPRVERGAVLVRHPVKGVSTFTRICPAAKIARWGEDAFARRAVTGARAVAGGVAQGALWLTVAPLAAAAAGVVFLVRGREAARTHLAEYYLPLMGGILAVTYGAYLFCMVAGCLLAGGWLNGMLL